MKIMRLRGCDQNIDKESTAYVTLHFQVHFVEVQQASVTRSGHVKHANWQSAGCNLHKHLPH